MAKQIADAIAENLSNPTQVLFGTNNKGKLFIQTETIIAGSGTEIIDIKPAELLVIEGTAISVEESKGEQPGAPDMVTVVRERSDGSRFELCYSKTTGPNRLVLSGYQVRELKT